MPRLEDLERESDRASEAVTEQLRVWGKTDKDVVKVLLLGNTGRGKSFLCNSLIKDVRFASHFSAKSVTERNDFFAVLLRRIPNSQQEVAIPYVIYDVPGLIEMSEENIVRNQTMITKAIADRPEARTLVVFVFGTQAGRIMGEEIAAYKAVQNHVPQLATTSLGHAVFINNLSANVKANPTKRADFELLWEKQVRKETGVADMPVGFGYQVAEFNDEHPQYDTPGMDELRISFLSLLHSLTPMNDVQGDPERPIELDSKRWEREIQEMNAKMIEMVKQHEEQLRTQREAFDTQLALMKKENTERESSLRKEIEELKNRPPQIKEVHHHHGGGGSGGGCTML